MVHVLRESTVSSSDQSSFSKPPTLASTVDQTHSSSTSASAGEDKAVVARAACFEDLQSRCGCGRLAGDQRKNILHNLPSSKLGLASIISDDHLDRLDRLDKIHSDFTNDSTHLEYSNPSNSTNQKNQNNQNNRSSDSTGDSKACASKLFQESVEIQNDELDRANHLPVKLVTTLHTGTTQEERLTSDTSNSQPQQPDATLRHGDAASAAPDIPSPTRNTHQPNLKHNQHNSPAKQRSRRRCRSEDPTSRPRHLSRNGAKKVQNLKSKIRNSIHARGTKNNADSLGVKVMHALGKGNKKRNGIPRFVTIDKAASSTSSLVSPPPPPPPPPPPRNKSRPPPPPPPPLPSPHTPRAQQTQQTQQTPPPQEPDRYDILSDYKSDEDDRSNDKSQKSPSSPTLPSQDLHFKPNKNHTEKPNRRATITSAANPSRKHRRRSLPSETELVHHHNHPHEDTKWDRYMLNFAARSVVPRISDEKVTEQLQEAEMAAAAAAYKNNKRGSVSTIGAGSVSSTSELSLIGPASALTASLPRQSWSPIPGRRFQVRSGENYSKNRTKEPSSQSLYEMVTIRCFRSRNRTQNVAQVFPLPIQAAFGCVKNKQGIKQNKASREDKPRRRGRPRSPLSSISSLSSEEEQELHNFHEDQDNRDAYHDDNDEEAQSQPVRIGEIRNTDVPEILVVHFPLPYEEPSIFRPKDDGFGGEIVLYLRPTRRFVDEMNGKKPMSPSARLFAQWCKDCETDSVMRSRFKVMGTVRELDKMKTLNWARPYNGRPVLITESGSVTRGTQAGVRYLEMTSNVHKWSFLAKKGLVSLIPRLQETRIDFGFTIEAIEDDEMPECILGAACMNHINALSLPLFTDPKENTDGELLIINNSSSS